MSKKKQPQCENSEKALIGSVLFEPSKFYNLNISKEWFFNKPHQWIWEAIEEIATTTPSWDPVMLAQKMDDKQLLSKVGGLDYLLGLQDHHINPHYSQSYAKDVEKAFNLRKELETLHEAIETVHNGDSCADDVIARLMAKPIERKYSNDVIFDEWRRAQEGDRSTIPTPYPSIDRQSGGVRQGMVTLFTGRSKSGKSMFLAHWYNFLGQQNIPILVVPLEDKREITIKRMASNFGNYDNSQLDAGGRFVSVDDGWVWDPVKDHQIETAVECVNHVSKYPVHFWDRKCTPKQLRGIAIRYKRKHDIRALFIDGAKDLLRPSGKYGDVGFDEEISQQLCAIAEELDIAVVAVHHLTKISDEERITVNHIRGSGNIVSDSRAVYALQSSGISASLVARNYPITYDEEGNSKMRLFECLSNNHGGTSSKCLEADLPCCQFKEVVKTA